jgi:peptidoglycan/LPS O-acetylase OafA/YrhL
MLRVRLLRVYPLIALGGILGAIAAAMGIGDVPHGVPILLLKHLVLWPDLTAHGYLYPLDPVAWSLFFELIANVAHAVLLRWLSVRNLMLGLIVSLIALTGAAIHRGHLNGGFGLADITVATARLAFSYTAGLILFRQQQMGALPVPRVPGVLLALALPIALMFPDYLLHYGSLHGARSENLIKDLGFVIILFPALVSLAARADLRGATAWGAKVLGELSYPIYSIQVPLLVVFSIEIAPRLSAYPPLLVWGLFMVGVATLSWVALEYFDKPARRWLSSRLSA